MRVAPFAILATQVIVTFEFTVDDCEKIVSIEDNKSHLRCQNECVTLVKEGWDDPFTDGVFNATCVFQHFTVEKQIIIPDNRCFSSLVFGSMMKSVNETVFVKSTLTRTPASCMKICQMRTDCHHWYFVVPRDEKVLLSTCVLESTEQILEDLSPSSTPSSLCNLDFLERPYARQTCGLLSQISPCAALSLEAVGGWKDCATRKGICHPELPQDLQAEKSEFRPGCCQEYPQLLTTTTTESIESSVELSTHDPPPTSDYTSVSLSCCSGEECEDLSSCQDDEDFDEDQTEEEEEEDLECDDLECDDLE